METKSSPWLTQLSISSAKEFNLCESIASAAFGDDSCIADTARQPTYTSETRLTPPLTISPTPELYASTSGVSGLG